MALTPWGGFRLGDPFVDSLERSIDRAFNRTFGGIGPLTAVTSTITAPALWSSVSGTHPMDVIETATSYEVHADAPGFCPDNIHVEVNQGQITVRGDKQIHQEKRDEGGKVWRKERGYRSFSRTFILPENANPDKVTAELDKGVLKVTVGKREQTPKPKPKRIQVREAANSA